MKEKCLHPECDNDLPNDGSRYPYCSFVCWLANNLDLGMTLNQAKAKISNKRGAQ